MATLLIAHDAPQPAISIPVTFTVTTSHNLYLPIIRK
jgi:hypothetical protein